MWLDNSQLSSSFHRSTPKVCLFSRNTCTADYQPFIRPVPLKARRTWKYLSCFRACLTVARLLPCAWSCNCRSRLLISRAVGGRRKRCREVFRGSCVAAHGSQTAGGTSNVSDWENAICFISPRMRGGPLIKVGQNARHQGNPNQELLFRRSDSSGTQLPSPTRKYCCSRVSQHDMRGSRTRKKGGFFIVAQAWPGFAPA